MAIEDKKIASETFWLNIAAESIYTTFEKRAAGVKNLKEVIAWAFAIFSATGFVGSVFGKAIENFNDKSLWCFGIAFFLLTFGYVFAGQAQYPVIKTYHPNDVSDISKAFGEAVKTQSKYFGIAAATTMLGFFFVAMAILFLFKHAKEKPKPEIKEAIIIPLLVKTSVVKKGDTCFIPVTVMTKPDANDVSISISAFKGDKDSVLLNGTFETDTSGRVFISHPIVPATANVYDSFKVKVGINTTDAGVLIERFSSQKVGKKK